MNYLLKFSLALAIIMSVDCYVRVCYYTNWSQYRQGVANYKLKNDYQTGLCTHIIFSFGKVVASGGGYVIAPYEWNDQSALYDELQALKRNDPNLKTLLAIGGWNHGSNGFKQMVKTPESRRFFIQQSVKYLQQYGFDGLDLDWEYPAQRGSPSGDKKLFSMLCKELAAVYHPKGMLVTAAVAAGVGSVDTSYEVREIAESLDFINLMTYDLYGGWNPTSGHHTNTNPNSGPNNVHKTVKHWINKGAHPSKLVLGLASYARTFALSGTCNWKMGSATKGSGAQGPHTGEAGFMAYYEVCNLKWVNHVCTKSSDVHAPYGSTSNRFVGYDDQESIAYKVNNVMKAYKLKGYMFWALDLDDFTGGVCNQGRYPLMNAAKKAAAGQPLNAPTCKTIKTCDGPNPPTVDPSVTTQPPVVVVDGRCKAKGIWVKFPSMDGWCQNAQTCQVACSVPCPDSGICDRCECDTGKTTTTMKPTTTDAPMTTTTTMKPTTTEAPMTTKAPGPKKNCKSLTERRFERYCTYYCYRCDSSKWFTSFCTCE